MSRLIEFRVWNTRNKNWYQEWEIICYNSKNGIFHLHSGAHDVFNIVMGTGLLDRNGTKIFEGDILKKDTDFGGVIPGIYTVKFDRYKFRLFGTRIYKGIGSIANNPSRWEIIGNIYENPERKS